VLSSDVKSLAALAPTTTDELAFSPAVTVPIGSTSFISVPISRSSSTEHSVLAGVTYRDVFTVITNQCTLTGYDRKRRLKYLDGDWYWWSLGHERYYLFATIEKQIALLTGLSFTSLDSVSTFTIS